MALESIIPKMLITESMVAIATGEFTNTFSEAEPLPTIEKISPKINNIPKYTQVARRIGGYFISNRKISLNLIALF